MEAILALAVEYGMGLPWLVLAAFLYFGYKKLAAVEHRLNSLLADTFTKAETKEWIEVQLAPTNQLMETMSKSLDKLSTAVDRLDDTMDEIRIDLLKKHSEEP